MLRSLLRSTPFRLMAALTITFFAFVCLAGFIALLLVRADLAARMEQQLQQTFAVIAQSYGEDDLTDLADLVASNASANPSVQRVFMLRNADGQILAGNIAVAPLLPAGWATVTADQIGLTGSRQNYRVLVGDIGEYSLLVGASYAEPDAVGTVVFDSLAVAGALFFTVVVSAGIGIAARGQRRIDSIAQTMKRIGRGELEARIPLTHNRDDIDELSVQVNQALDRLSALVEGMRHVSVNIAHDLKTPLNRLTFTLMTAAGTAEKGHSVLALVTQAQDEVGQINTTFDALLRIAQIEAGARRARFKPVSIAAVLENLYEAYAEVAGESSQELVLKSETLPLINGDQDLLTQLFANLIENAIRHCPNGTRIVIETLRSSKQIIVSVSDNGPGIPLKAYGKVFERLYRLEESRSTSGSGLGLSLVKAIVDLHSAEIVVSDNAPGTKMTVIFNV
ncbi:MAG: ATPase protein [Devosia sp.]|nr:ATPase protein [Devosia sp.]